MAEPVSLTLAKAQIGLVDDTSRDTLITGYIKAAREWVENYTGHILVQREVTDSFDRFTRYLELSKRPIVTVDEVAYTDTDEAQQTYSGFVAGITGRYPVRVYPAHNDWWPSTLANSQVIVTYTSGYEAGEEPQPLIQAMLLLVGHWFEHRAAAEQQAPTEVPFAVLSLCDQYRAPGL